MMKICIMGTGYVGLVTGTCFAEMGLNVTCVDTDVVKISKLQRGEPPIYEPGLEELIKKGMLAGRLHFSTDIPSTVKESSVIFIAVGTPTQKDDDQADLTAVFNVADTIAAHAVNHTVLITKSTVPVDTAKKLEKHLKTKNPSLDVDIVSNPEFLREGSAVYDTLHPTRVVIGALHDEAFEKLELLHKPLNAPVVRVKPESAQMAKYAANAYLATRITFINQIADLCEKNGADVEDVIQAIGFDHRVGSHYWYPGLGYGGSCFPKDVKELAAYSKAVGETGNLFIKVNELNDARLERLMANFSKQVGGWQGKKVAFLGLSFKPHTDDMREAPSTKIIPRLLADGATVIGYDPMAKPDPSLLGATSNSAFSQVDMIEEACQDADVILAVVEWPQIVSFDFAAVRNQSKQQWLIDARNQFEPEMIKKIGITYIGIGRSIS